MLTKYFYDIIDKQLIDIIEKYKNDPEIKNRENSKTGQKAYAFLIWFLEFYGKTTNYLPYITEGSSDGFCDIIFDTPDSRGNTVFYVIQSKWNNRNNALKEISAKEVGYALNNFSTIMRGYKKLTNNERFNKKLSKLQSHIETNGQIKFIVLSLCQANTSIADNITSFEDEFKRIRLEFIDINRIKRDYIERQYKQIMPANPLEYTYDPEDTPVTLRVERPKRNNGSFIKIDKPFDAYIFLVKPKTIFNLFEEFGLSLFFKNVRNPISDSDINQQIEKTIIENPDYFWYYNNGITAITDDLSEISARAKQFELSGLQIINGAQTVHAIHSAYKKATRRQQANMDKKVLITLRLLQSGGKDFDLQVTRYTNSQHPISDRDFHANDEVQIRLQNESFNTNLWYEKRRDEFRGETPDGIRIVPNFAFANAYLAYELQAPVKMKGGTKNLLFLSHNEQTSGLYELVFNENTKFEDMLCSMYLLMLLASDGDFEKVQSSHLIYVLALFKVIFSKYIEKKYTHVPPINKKVKELVEKGETTILLKVFQFIQVKVTELSENQEVSENFMISKSHYDTMKEHFAKMDVSIDDIENFK
jgi:phosphotransferase system IIB component